ncbi:MAG: type II toxin-antitoxin system PemK/MazF family toxin [Acidobacteriota bacterium]
MGMEIKRFEVYLIDLDPTKGSEIQKTRPCLVISPDEMNKHINTIIIAPMTTQGKVYPTRVECKFKNKKGLIVLDQIRTVDKTRLIRKLGAINYQTQIKVLDVLAELFAP